MILFKILTLLIFHEWTFKAYFNLGQIFVVKEDHKLNVFYILNKQFCLHLDWIQNERMLSKIYMFCIDNFDR